MKFLFDFFPILLFFIAYKLFDIYVATGVAIAATFAQIAVAWIKTRTVAPMQLVTLAGILVFGGLTLWLQNDTFIKMKPTIVKALFGFTPLGGLVFGPPLVG